ncbi:hypothetical protein K7X08_037339 [Anisodus acutangulus]|uniref:SBP-type domain-containing protein n=2 Tax=Anisodus TaxID=243963 RepID=A0A9Q1MWS4_9SOLA|nr:hypothetical protein K7X08_037339 [Anisodus acutangulus]
MGSCNSDSLNGLKFGKKIYFGNVGGSSFPVTGDGDMPPAPAKRGRGGVVQGGQPPRCQVEGCQVDLSDAKAYYSRHKVCGMHSKSPTVIVAGLEQRFCQQCSRFHQLPEFDQGKRSCRRRLACHNERRRKPPSGSLFSTHYGNLSSSIFENNSSRSGSFLVDFSSHQNVNESSWPNTRASEQGWDHQSTASGKFLQRPWLNDSENAASELVLQGSATRTSYPGPSVPSGDCFPGVSDSTGALSLLSNRSWGSRDRSSSLGVNIDGVHTIQPSGSHGAPTNHFSSPSSSSHAMPSDLGLGQMLQASDDPYCAELGMSQHVPNCTSHLLRSLLSHTSQKQINQCHSQLGSSKIMDDAAELRYYEEEDTPGMKTFKGATTGLVAGTLWGAIIATWHDVPRVERNVALPGLIRTLKMMGNHGVTFAAIGGVYIGVEQLVQNYRMKRDFINGAVGGFVAGASILGYKGRSISTALSAGAALAVTSGIIDSLGATTRTDNGKEYYPYTTKKRVAAE